MNSRAVKGAARPHIGSLVINWHLTEACNYRCKYCFATWKKPTAHLEVITDSKNTAVLMRELYQFFRPGNRDNPLNEQLSWHSVRLNLAGGEPLLHSKYLSAVIHHAKEVGFDEVSMITNGSYLTRELLQQLAPELSWLGVSVDSTNHTTNLAIGRVNSRDRLLCLEALGDEIREARARFSQLKIKINTVVNRFNHGEDLGRLIECYAPDRWKVLRVLTVIDEGLGVNDEQFSDFVARHKAYVDILSVEDNRDMRESYIMVDPYGRFFQNSQLEGEKGYAYSDPILRIGAEAAFDAVCFDSRRFSSRYFSTVSEGCA